MCSGFTQQQPRGLREPPQNSPSDTGEERDGKAKALITEHKHRPFNMWKYF